MNIHEIEKIAAEWALTEPLIRRVWLFGSRVRGTERPDSDVDMAVEILKLPGDTDACTTFMFEGKRLKSGIQARLEIVVDLEWYGGPIETPTVHSGLVESSNLIYEIGDHALR